MAKQVQRIAREPIDRLRKISSMELVARLNRFERAKLEDLTEDQVRTRIGRLLDGYATKTVSFQTERVFRARVVHANQITRASELWYPPPHLATAGRFNHQGESVFYAASTLNAALWEVRPKPGENVCVLVCGARDPAVDLTCAHVGLYRFRGRRPIEPIPDIRSSTEFLAPLVAAKVDKKWLRVDEFLADLASRPEDERNDLYKATRAFGDILLKINTAKGLMFPSVASDLAAFNLRLAPDAADAHFFAAEAWEFSVVDHLAELPSAPPSKPGFLAMTPERRSSEIAPDGSINWAEGFSGGATSDLMLMPSRIAAARDALRQ